jgi:hypothetical protein
MAAPEKEITVAAAGPGESKKQNWLLLGLGGVLVVGLVSAIGGGGGGGGGGDPQPEEGCVAINW